MTSWGQFVLVDSFDEKIQYVQGCYPDYQWEIVYPHTRIIWEASGWNYTSLVMFTLFISDLSNQIIANSLFFANNVRLHHNAIASEDSELLQALMTMC